MTRHPFRALVLPALVAAAVSPVLSPRDVRAEEADSEATEQARALFQEGVGFSDRHEWQPAAERFRAALALRDAPTIRFNLAAVLAELGQPVEAIAELEVVLADASTTDELRSQARTLLTQLEPRTATLAIERTPELAGLPVTVDGTPVAEERLAEPYRVAPGTHVVAATRDGEEVAREEVMVAAGDTEPVRLGVVPPPEDVARTEVEPIETPPPITTHRPLVRDWRLWTGVAAGVVVVVTAVALGATLGGGTEDPVEGNLDPGTLVWR